MRPEEKTILIVDDDEGLLDELDALLQDSGYRTVPFTDGALATEYARRSLPDLILLDLKLAGKSGFVIATELTRIPKTAHIPILGMTGYYDGPMYAILMNIIGFRGCLMKPIDPGKLLARISELLGDHGEAATAGNGDSTNRSGPER